MDEREQKDSGQGPTPPAAPTTLLGDGPPIERVTSVEACDWDHHGAPEILGGWAVPVAEEAEA